MKKIYVLVLLAVGMIACTEKNVPDNGGNGNGNGNATDTTTVSPSDTTIVTTDTIQITWNDNSANIVGQHEGVTVTATGGTVNVVSTVKDITYLLSGAGTGSLRIEGTNRHQLILRNLTLSCSDGPAINNQCKKSCFVVLEGTNSLTDGSTYASSEEDRKAAFFSEGQMIFSGSGSLQATGNYKHAIASDDYIQFAESTGSLTLKAASDGIHANDALYFDGGTFSITAGSDGIQCDSNIIINNGTITISADADGIQSDTAAITINGGNITITKAGDKGITAFGDITINDGTIRISSDYKCIKSGKKENNKVISAGNISINGGDIQVVCNSTKTSSGGGSPWGGGSSNTDNNSPEAIEAKGTITISDGFVYAQSADDAINAGGDFTISGGYVCAYSTGNDGLDANGNMYIKGGLVYAIGAGSPEMAIDANSEEQKKLYVQGGTIIALGSLESGAQLTQACYQNSSWNANTWYSITVGTETFAFKTPTKSSNNNGSGHGPGGGSQNTPLVVSGSTQPTVKSGVTVNGGTSIFNNMGVMNPTVSAGSTVSLSTYSSNSRW